MENATPPGTGPTLGSSSPRLHPLAAFRQTNLDGLGFYMLLLMLRNVTTAGFVVEDPMPPHSYSLPGCVIAAPSFPANTPGVDQDYVFNWVRDAAITMIEIAEAKLPAIAGGVDALGDYVSFARLCYDNAQPSKGHACFTVSGQSRQWTEQSDGPALQTLALLRAYDLSLPRTRSGNIHDEVRRESAERRAGRTVGLADGSAHPCPGTGGSGVRCNKRCRQQESGAGALHRRPRCDRGIRGGSSR